MIADRALNFLHAHACVKLGADSALSHAAPLVMPPCDTVSRKLRPKDCGRALGGNAVEIACSYARYARCY